MGVASLNAGGAGLGEGRWRGCTCGGALLSDTGFWLGEGGMASPSRGVRAPFMRFPPGMGGRRRGAGEELEEDMSGL